MLSAVTDIYLPSWIVYSNIVIAIHYYVCLTTVSGVDNWAGDITALFYKITFSITNSSLTNVLFSCCCYCYYLLYCSPVFTCKCLPRCHFALRTGATRQSPDAIWSSVAVVLTSIKTGNTWSSLHASQFSILSTAEVPWTSNCC